MSELSGGGAGFNRPVSQPPVSSQVTRVQAQQAQTQQRQALATFGAPASADQFTRTVAENSMGMGIPREPHAFRSELSRSLYPSKKDKANGGDNPFSGTGVASLFQDTQHIDWNARQQFAENLDSHGSLT